MKRHRNTNFTGQEKELLLTLFDKYKSTIENKRTDGATTNEKNKVWEILTQQFNSVTPSLNNRSVDSLKIYYKNLKKGLRKKAGEFRKDTYLTGGGPPPNDLSESEKKLLAIVNKKTVFGLTNLFDSDGDGLNKSQDTNTLDEINREINDSTDVLDYQNPKSDWKRHKPSDLKRPLNGELVSITDHTANTAPNADKIEIIYVDDGLYADPSRPTASTANENQLTAVSTKSRTSSLTPKSTRRRRPVIRTFTSSSLGEKYESLADQKLELVNCLKKEHELRLKALELDIKLKEKQLNS